MRSVQGRSSRAPRRWRAAAALATLTLALIATVPQASAQDVEVELGIVFGDQTCDEGSDRLISAAFPFDVEACFSEGGSPLGGHDMYFEINHGDGAVETIDGVTDANGVVRSRPRPPRLV